MALRQTSGTLLGSLKKNEGSWGLIFCVKDRFDGGWSSSIKSLSDILEKQHLDTWGGAKGELKK